MSVINAWLLGYLSKIGRLNINLLITKLIQPII